MGVASIGSRFDGNALFNALDKNSYCALNIHSFGQRRINTTPPSKAAPKKGSVLI